MPVNRRGFLAAGVAAGLLTHWENTVTFAENLDPTNLIKANIPTPGAAGRSRGVRVQREVDGRALPQVRSRLPAAREDSQVPGDRQATDGGRSTRHLRGHGSRSGSTRRGGHHRRSADLADRRTGEDRTHDRGS